MRKAIADCAADPRIFESIPAMATWSSTINKFKDNVQKLKQVPAQTMELAASQVKADLEATFAAGRDPFGEPWKPRKIDTGMPLLVKSGDLNASRQVIATGTTLATIYSDFKAKFHQDGTDVIPQRRLVPDGTEKLPDKWTEAIMSSFSTIVRKLFR